MTTSHDLIDGTDQHRRRQTRRRVQAILAGGLVLGIGAAVTLATWNDSEFAGGTFAAGRFGIEGSTDGSTFRDDPSTTPATLAFGLSAGGLAPSSTSYAPFAVRENATSTADGSVTLGISSTSGTLTGLTYRVIATSAWGCDASTTGTTVIPAGTAISTVPAGTTFTLTQGSAGSAGTAQNFCFILSSDSTIAQGQSGTVVWAFDATTR